MDQLNKFHETGGDPSKYDLLWYIHYLLILAFGKAFIVRSEKGQSPPGAEFFVRAMKLLPDVMFLYSNPIQSIEILCCTALYLQCLDFRSAAYVRVGPFYPTVMKTLTLTDDQIGQAVRIALEQGMNTDAGSNNFSQATVERSRETWWTVYVLDRLMSSTLGVPLTLADENISALLPSFAGSTRKSLALSILIKVSQATAEIQRTVYRKDGRKDQQLLSRMKEALKIVAKANDERNASFPLNLQKPVQGMSRLSAYLHLFHHQCIILTTRPLLFSFWQQRLQSSTTLRVASRGGARSLLRVCVSSAQQTINILEALQSQSLLESFLPFDLDAAFSAAIVLLLGVTIDPSLLRNDASRLPTIYAVLDEMISRGNLIARFHKSELQQLETNLGRLPGASEYTSTGGHGGHYRTTSQGTVYSTSGVGNASGFGDFQISPDYLGEWNSEDGLSGDQLTALADYLDFEHLDWLGPEMFQPLDPSMRF